MTRDTIITGGYTMTTATKTTETAIEMYKRLKTKSPDCIFLIQTGDFYEVFHDDAAAINDATGATLLLASFRGEDQLPKLGVPYHSVDGYLRKMIRAGYSVAICERDGSSDVNEPADQQTAQHTPGPWRVERWRYNTPGRESVPTIQNDTDAVAEALPLWGSATDREPERIANARLIAAAPDLLDVARSQLDLIDQLESLGVLDDSTDGFDRIAEYREQARAAIKAATND